MSNQSTLKRMWSAAAALLMAACGVSDSGGVGSKAAADPETATVEQDLSTTEQCHTLPANTVLQRGGAVTTTRTYGSSGCASGYIIDLIDYDAKFDVGTFVGYADTVPTSQVECEKLNTRAYVWRHNDDGSTTFLGGAFPRGTWVKDPWGNARCQPPSMLLEGRIPGFAPGGRYRLGVRAHTLDAAGNVLRRQVHVETVARTNPLPQELLDGLRAGRDDLQATLGTPSPYVMQLWNLPGTTGREAFCRASQLELSFIEFAYPSLTELGATTSRINTYINAERSIHNLICGTRPSGSTAVTLQQSLLDAASNLYSMHGSIGVAIGADRATAGWAVNQRLFDVLHMLMSHCNADAMDVLDFVHHGKLPAGMLGQNPLFERCNATLPTLRTQLAIGIGQPGPIESCIDQAVSSMRQCSSPTASGEGAPAADNGPPTPSDCSMAISIPCPAGSPAGKVCWEMADSGGEDCNYRSRREAADREVRRLNEFVKPHEDRLAEMKTEAKVTGTAGAILGFGGTAVKGVQVFGGPAPSPGVAKGVGYAMVAGGILRAATMVTEHLIKETQGVVDRVRDNIADICRANPRAPACQNMRCPEFDFESGPGWYEFGSDQGNRAVNEFDRMTHCMCEGLGRRSEILCPSAEEQSKQKCLTNPVGPIDGVVPNDGPDDGPRPECILQMQPGTVDHDAIALDMCEQIMPNCGDVYVTPSGDCGCGENPNPDEANPEDLCRQDQVSRCLDDVMAGVSLRGGSCACQPLDAGTKPWGGLGCRLNASALLGSRDKWLTKRHDDIFVNRVYDIPGAAAQSDLLAFRQGFVAASSTPLNRKFFAKLGSELTVDVVTPATRPASGYGGALQAYCTRGNVVNRFLGQVELSPLANGRLHKVSIPVSSTNRTDCFNTASDFTITFAVNSEPSAPGNIGLANFDFGGTNVPITSPNPICPDPSPVQDPAPFPSPWVNPVNPGTFPVGNWPWIQECGAFGCG